MKIKILIVFILSLSKFFLFSIWSQNEINALETKLKGELSEFIRIDTENELAWNLRRKDSIRAKKIATDALNHSEKLQYDKGIGGAKKVLGAFKVIKGERTEAIILYRASIQAFKAASYFKGLAQVYQLLGNALAVIGDLDEAIKMYYEGIRATDNCECESIRAGISISIANIKVEQSNFEGVEEIYRNALNIQKKNLPPKRLAITYFTIGNFFAKNKQLDSALVYYSEADSIFSKLKLKTNLATLYGSMGNVFFQKKNKKKMMLYYEKSHQLNKENGAEKSLAYSSYQLGNVFFESNDYSKSERLFNESLSIAKKLNLIDLASKNFKALSNLKEAVKQPTKALQFYQQYIALRDSINNQDSDKQIKEIEEKYGNEKLQRTLEKQDNEIKRNRIINYSIGTTLVLTFLIMLLMYRNYNQKRKHNLLVAAQKEAIHQKEVKSLKQISELRSLNALQDGQEIERKRIAEALHNSMGSLLSAIQMHLQSFGTDYREKSKNKDSDLIHKTIGLVKEASVFNRNIAHEMMPPILMKFGLKAALDHLTDKLKTPDVKVTTFVYGMKERYQDKLELALYRIIDELFNNILKHANATEITVQLTEHENSLNILIEDNGKGFSYDSEDTNHGMGLNNIQARIKHFKGRLLIDSSPGKGTTIGIDVPYK